MGNFELRPKRLNLLLGENGTSKTSLFEALLLVKDLIVLGRPAAQLFADKKTVWEHRDTQSFELDIEGLEAATRTRGVSHRRLESSSTRR